MPSRTKSRVVRIMRVENYMRLWATMRMEDRILALCLFERILASVRPGNARTRQIAEAALTFALQTLGTPGTLASVIGTLIAQIEPRDVLDCQRRLRRGD